VDSTGALKLKAIPERMLIIGGGIIGLEMGTVYSALGARLDVVEMLPGLMPGADRDLVKVWDKMNARRFDRVMLETRTVSAEARDDGIWVKFEGKNAPADRKAMSQCCWPWAVAPPARPSGPTRQACRSTNAVSLTSTSRCVPTCLTSMPSATSWVSPCWRTRPCMKVTLPPKPLRATRASLMRA